GRAAGQGASGGDCVEGGPGRGEGLWEPGGPSVYVFGADGGEVPTRGVSGLLLVTPAGGGTAVRLSLFPSGDGPLRVRTDLSGIEPGTVSVELFLSGVPGSGRGVARGRGEVPFRLDADAVAIARQVICPVTDMPLGEMGKPPKAVIAGRTVYVCCEPCLDVIREDPQKYFAKIGKGLPDAAGEGMLMVST